MRPNIVLIGYMGCGKTTVSREILYGIPAQPIDTDEEIVKRKEMSIPEIFEKEGEEAFRTEETKLLQELLDTTKQGIVLSTGGGMPLREENRRLLKQIGTVIYLKASPEETYQRLKNDTNRPLLKAPDRQERIRKMIAERMPIYMEAADFVISVDGRTPEDIAAEIKDLCWKGIQKGTQK